MNRPVEVTLYTRTACSLCEKAKQAMREAETRYSLTFRLTEIDVDYDLDLLARFNDHVPVVYVDGVEVFRHRVEPEAFAAAVRNSSAG